MQTDGKEKKGGNSGIRHIDTSKFLGAILALKNVFVTIRMCCNNSGVLLSHAVLGDAFTELLAGRSWVPRNY